MKGSGLDKCDLTGFVSIKSQLEEIYLTLFPAFLSNDCLPLLSENSFSLIG